MRGHDHPPSAGAPNRPAQRIAGAPISWGVCEVPNWGYQLRPTGCSTRCRTSGSRPPNSGPTASSRRTRSRWPPCSHATSCPPSAASPRADAPARTRPAPGDRIASSPVRRDPRRGPRAVRGLGARRIRHPSAPRRRRMADTPARNLDRHHRRSPRNRESAPCSTPTSAPWSRPATRCSGCSRARRSSLCLDTGHLLIGGTDPAEPDQQAPDRIAHTHLKDVDNTIAEKVRPATHLLPRGRAGHVPATRGPATSTSRPS